MSDYAGPSNRVRVKFFRDWGTVRAGEFVEGTLYHERREVYFTQNLGQFLALPGRVSADRPHGTSGPLFEIWQCLDCGVGKS